MNKEMNLSENMQLFCDGFIKNVKRLASTRKIGIDVALESISMNNNVSEGLVKSYSFIESDDNMSNYVLEELNLMCYI